MSSGALCMKYPAARFEMYQIVHFFFSGLRKMDQMEIGNAFIRFILWRVVHCFCFYPPSPSPLLLVGEYASRIIKYATVGRRWCRCLTSKSNEKKKKKKGFFTGRQHATFPLIRYDHSRLQWCFRSVWSWPRHSDAKAKRSSSPQLLRSEKKKYCLSVYIIHNLRLRSRKNK